VLLSAVGQLTRPSSTWYRERKKRTFEPTEPSAEKTIGDLMVAANGGEHWSLSLHTSVRQENAPEAIMQATNPRNPVVPLCDACGVAVPGLLTLPCSCDGAVCAECFVEYKCDEFEKKKSRTHKCPLGCSKKQASFIVWRPLQPRLVLQADAARRQADDQKKQRKAVAQQRQGEGAHRVTLRKQPKVRPLPALRPLATLAAVSNKTIERRAKDKLGAGAGGKLLYLAKELRDLAKAGDAKVLLTPPANVGVRTTFVEMLAELIGKSALADLNVKKADQGRQVAAAETDRSGCAASSPQRPRFLTSATLALGSCAACQVHARLR
jgi:hypothetical protein